MGHLGLLYTASLVATTASHPALLWLNPEQVPLFRAVAKDARLDIIAAGSPDPTKSTDIAAALGAPVIDNLHTALASTNAAMAIIADPGAFAAQASARSDTSDAADARALHEARARGVRVLSLEPLPSSVLQLDEPSLTTPDENPGIVLGQSAVSAAATSSSGAPGEWATFCPLARLSRPVRDAAELIAQLGAVRLVAVESLAGAGQGSLGARLYDACESIVWLMGLPDRVDGAYAPPPTPQARARAAHVLPGETLRGLDGDLAVNMRFADGRAASVVASNRAGRWMRTLTLLGENGRLRIFDDGFAWYAQDGRLVDSSRQSGGNRPRGSDSVDSELAAPVQAIADQITRLLDPRIPPDQPTDGLSVLATTGAALLSARTGEGESPATILRMARTG